MKILIDADACPREVKDLTFRASARLKLPVVMVADRPVWRPDSALVSMVVVPRNMDSADQRIVEDVRAGDLVITADLPLAAAVVKKGGTAINPRGEVYTEENIGERLSMRDFLMSLRDTGENIGGPPPYSRKDRQRFADAIDRILTHISVS